MSCMILDTAGCALEENSYLINPIRAEKRYRANDWQYRHTDSIHPTNIEIH